ncbi:MAG TPA: muconolactone Delta-isomerase family protein, partial [Streptosporangiaceae bacterium]|nr:muconolactone Delta-isomerase family protein [Streptosporangiaceae bacterium]
RRTWSKNAGPVMPPSSMGMRAAPEADAMQTREAARSGELAADGHLLRLWRPPLAAGEWRSLGLFRAADAAELEGVLSSMPLRVWRHDTVTPLTAHPSDPGSGAVMINPASADEADLLDAVLTRWKAAVDAHQPEQVAALFTADAIFQGLHPYAVGPTAVAEYYAAQPMGMTAAYKLGETRALSDGLVLGYLTVDFGFRDRATLTVSLSVIIRRDAGGWRIAHYQVSRLD